MRKKSRIDCFALLLAANITGPGCGEEIQETYGVEIIGPKNTNYLAGAKEVALAIGPKEIARTAIHPGAPFSLAGKGIEIDTTGPAAIRVRALDGEGKVVAFGQTPEIEYSLFSPIFRVFIQKPGTFGRTLDLPFPLKGHVAMPVPAPPIAGVPGAVPVTIPLFGLGRALVQDPETKAMVERYSSTFYFLNPLTHDIHDASNAPGIAGVPQPRADATALERDGLMLVFGGAVKAPLADVVRPTSQLDQYRMRRVDFSVFAHDVGVTRTSDLPAVPRSAAVLATASLTFAFGGRGENGPLDTVIAIDPTLDAALSVVSTRMAAPREGHTATAVTGSSGREILVFGGAPPGGVVAEIFLPGMTQTFARPEGDAGPGRRDHAAFALPLERAPDRVLIVGGRGDDGMPLGSSVSYSPSTKRIEPGPITLRTPRWAFAAFVVGEEMVIAGGLNAAGTPIGNAEVYSFKSDLPTVEFAREVPAFARARAKAVVLPNQSVILLGGEEAGELPSAVIEIYQPDRL